MKRFAHTLAVSLMLIPACLLWAQEPEHECAAGAEVDFAPGPISGRAFKSVELFVAETRPERTLRLVDLESERAHIIKLPAGIPLKAQAKREFDGRGDLEFSDLRPGQHLRLTFSAANRKLVAVRVLKSSAAKRRSGPDGPAG